MICRVNTTSLMIASAAAIVQCGAASEKSKDKSKPVKKSES